MALCSVSPPRKIRTGEEERVSGAVSTASGSAKNFSFFDSSGIAQAMAFVSFSGNALRRSPQKTPGRYVGIEDQEDDGEPFEEKMARLTGELSELFAQSHALEDEIRRKLGAIGYDI